MSSISNREIIQEYVDGNGRTKEGGDTIRYIIEYRNTFDNSSTWKLCRNKKEYTYYMEHGAFVEPFLMWERKETLSDFQNDDSDILLPNSHNNYGVKDHRIRKEKEND